MTIWTWLVVAALAGGILGASGARAMLGRARRGRSPMDLPDERRLHETPTPRGGGIGVPLAGLAGLPLAIGAGSPTERHVLIIVVLVWALPNGLVGIIDDHRPMRTAAKLAFQFMAASVAVALGLRVDAISIPPLGTLELGVMAAPLSTLWLVWTANVFNFIDGMDALAAGCGAICAVGLAILALGAGTPGHAALALGLAGAFLGFLPFNLPPARIFMGDGGSLFAGAALGGLTLAICRPEAGGLPLVAPALVLAALVWDATFTLLRRAVRGDPIRSHRTHIYQRLATAGWPHRRVRALYLGLTAAGVAASLMVVHGSPPMQAVALGVTAGAFPSMVCLAARAEKRADHHVSSTR